jgi:hypothetical protein
MGNEFPQIIGKRNVELGELQNATYMLTAFYSNGDGVVSEKLLAPVCI